MSAILSAEPPPLASEDRPLPPALERIVEHCLVKELRGKSWRTSGRPIGDPTVRASAFRSG
jgi:hypothetical protein